MSKDAATVGLMTMSNVMNFGSALQAYATVELVKKHGYDCVLIDYLYPSKWHVNNAIGGENQSVANPGKAILKSILQKLGLLKTVRWLRACINSSKIKMEQHEFEKFLNNIPRTAVRYDRNSILKNAPVFDIYMTGSDQTWNPRYMHTDYAFLLNFAPNKAPKISYAASFGATEIFPEYREEYAKYLSQYDRISVRELTGVTLVKELTGKDASHAIDPTLMLNYKEWSKCNRNKLNLPEKYIFCYILDYVFSPYPQVLDLIDHISSISGLPVVLYGENVSYLSGKYKIVGKDIGPDGFVECFCGASFVVTNSFHGAAFSVNFEKDFFAVLNHSFSKDDRVKSFLRSVDMGERGLFLSQTDISKITLESMKTNHRSSREKLQILRENSEAYLREALDFATQKCKRVNHD